jgi:Tol biopolymer transport system component
VEGKEADARTDIFALGVVIYEMATGRKAFEGDSKASVIAKILTGQPPPIRTIQPVSPPELDHVVQRCLVKKPEERWQSAAELSSQLQELAEANLQIFRAERGKELRGEAKEIEPKPAPAIPVAISQPKLLRRLLRSRAWKVSFIGMLLALTIGSVVVWRVRQQTETQPKEMSFRALTSYSTENPLESAAISPDGKYLAFSSKGKLSIQITQSGEKRSVKLPAGFYVASVSWFPDGTKLLLSRPETGWTQVNGETFPEYENSLWSLSILGGTPQKIVDHALFPSISPDGTLVAFSRFNPERRNVNIWVVGSNGEGQRPIRDLSRNDESYLAPVWLTNGERIFYIRDDRHAHWIESCDMHGKQVTSIYPSKSGLEYSAEWEGIQGYCWARDGRILFSLKEKGRRAGPASLWEIKVDATTGRPLGPARRITEWSNFGILHAEDLSITADGKQLVTLRITGQTDVYVADLAPGGKAMKNPKRLTFAENDDAVWDWTTDSRAVLFMSLRNGNWDVFKQDIKQQDIDQAEAEPIAATPQREAIPSLSPDGAFILYKVSQEPGPSATRLMRVPVSGGPPELVMSGENIKNFSCAREAKLCVVAEEVEGKQVLSTFDPLKGRGEKLSLPDYPGFAYGILSPQGKLIDKMKSGPDGLYIRVRSLTGGPVQEITFKKLTGEYTFKGWSLDGKGVYIDHLTRSDFESFYAGLDGQSHLLWKRGLSPGWWLDNPVPSPDGRHLAFTLGTRESNAWVLENF